MKQTERKDRLCVIATGICLLIYTVWRLGFTIPGGNGTLAVICWIVLTLVEFVGLLELAVFLYERMKKESVPLPVVKEQNFPDVDVFVFTINEPEELLAKTLYACRKMAYPDPKKVHIYLCDDGSRSSMEHLARQMGVHYLSRRNNTDAKAGNFNHAMTKSRSPLIAIFDADMMPRKHFLMKTVPYIAANKKVGFVQTPQHFYRKDIFQRALQGKGVPHNEQDYFYQVIQQTKNASNSVILAGSNTLLNRAAVEQIGGFVTGTLTEDFSTGIALQQNGYTGISVNEVLADGLPPMDFASLVKQRRRWAKGCIQSGRKTRYLLGRNLSLRQKLNYFSSIIYWYSSLKRLIYMVAPMLFCLAGIGVMRCVPWEILAFWLPLYVCISLCVYRFSNGIRSLHWTNIYETVLMPFLLPAVLQELFGFHQKTFDVTSKKQAAKDGKKMLAYLAPFVILLVLTLVSLAMVMYRSYMEVANHYAMLIVYLLINCYYLFTACQVVVGSEGNGESPLFDIQQTVQYKDDAEDAFVKIRTVAMGEDTIQTGVYDELWTGGILRIPREEGDLEIPVRYEKNGLWKLETAEILFDNYREYIYYLHNR